MVHLTLTMIAWGLMTLIVIGGHPNTLAHVQINRVSFITSIILSLFVIFSYMGEAF